MRDEPAPPRLGRSDRARSAAPGDPLQGLQLRPIVHSEHHPALRWMQPQPDDVADIAVEVRSVENLNVPARQGCTPRRCQIRGLIAIGGLIGVAALVLPAHHDVFVLGPGHQDRAG
jgi:hypothetical protein